MADIFELPEDFIGKEDEQRLRSFGGHLIANGCATRWHWERRRNVDVAFEVFHGGADESLLFAITRDREEDVFLARDPAGGVLARGKLDHVMAILDAFARGMRSDEPA